MKRGKDEEAKQSASRAQTEALFTWCEKEDMLGAPVHPVFDADPELVPEASAFKKLSDEEEIALRKAEQAALLAARNKEAADSAGAEDGKDTSSKDGNAVGKLQNRFGSSESKNEASGAGGNSSSGSQQMGKSSKKDFMKLLETTLGGGGGPGGPKVPKGGRGVGSKGGGGFKLPPGGSAAGRKNPAAAAHDPHASDKVTAVVLTKGMSAKMRALLEGNHQHASTLSDLIVDATKHPEALSPFAKDKAPGAGRALPTSLKTGSATSESASSTSDGKAGSKWSALSKRRQTQGLSSLMSAASDDSKLQGLRQRSLKDANAAKNKQTSAGAAGSQPLKLRAVLGKNAVAGQLGKGGLSKLSSAAGTTALSSSSSFQSPANRERNFSRTPGGAGSMQGFGRNRNNGGSTTNVRNWGKIRANLAPAASAAK